VADSVPNFRRRVWEPYLHDRTARTATPFQVSLKFGIRHWPNMDMPRIHCAAIRLDEMVQVGEQSTIFRNCCRREPALPVRGGVVLEQGGPVFAECGQLLGRHFPKRATIIQKAEVTRQRKRIAGHAPALCLRVGRLRRRARVGEPFAVPAAQPLARGLPALPPFYHGAFSGCFSTKRAASRSRSGGDKFSRATARVLRESACTVCPSLVQALVQAEGEGGVTC
jgi:hypothetical protein